MLHHVQLRKSAVAELLTTRQVQELLQVDRTTIYRMAESGRLPAVRVGKQWRFPQGEIERWLQSRGAGVSVAPVRETPASSPTNRGGHLAELLPIPCAQIIQDTCAELLGVMMLVTDTMGKPVTRVSNPCGFYEALIGHGATLEHCMGEWQQMAGAVPIEPRFATSSLGLLCARGLIRAGNELKGMVFVGGIAPEEWPPDEARLAQIARHFGVEINLIRGHLHEVYRLDRAQMERVLKYTQRVADIFSSIVEERSLVHGRLQAIAALSTL